MASLLDAEIRVVLNEVIKSSELSLKLMKKCLEAFMGRTKPEEVLRETEKGSEILSFTHDQIRTKISEVIARFQPMATDLRTLISLMEISYGLVRLGRYSRNIAQALKTLEGSTKCDIGVVLRPAEVTEEMVKLALKAVETKDTALADEVIRMDDEVDGAYESYLREKVLSGEEKDVICAVATTLILRYLERMADHAVQIAEEAKFMAGGR